MYEAKNRLQNSLLRPLQYLHSCLFCLCCQHVASKMLQEDAPAGEDGSEDSGSDEDDSEEESDESSDDDEDDDEDEEEEKEDEPLSLEWPDTRRRQATYLFLLPIIFPLWLTVPDVRNQVETPILTFSVLRALALCFTSACFSDRNPESSLWSPSLAPFCGLPSSPTSWCGGRIRSVTVTKCDVLNMLFFYL